METCSADLADGNGFLNDVVQVSVGIMGPEKVLKLLTVPPEFVHTAIILTSSAERELLTVPDASEPADTTEPSAAVGTLNAGTERGQPLHEMVFS